MFINVKQVCVDPPRITALTLPACFAGAWAPTADMDQNAATIDGTDRRTDVRTPDRYIDPARHIMRAAS